MMENHLFQTLQFIASPLVNHIYDENGKMLHLHNLLTSNDQDTHKIWTQATSNELGCLAKGNAAGVKFTATIEFISKSSVPQGRAVTYANFILDHRPLKNEQNRVRLAVGGEKLTYNEDPGSPAASLIETKLTINSVISDAQCGAQFMGLDLKFFSWQPLWPKLSI